MSILKNNFVVGLTAGLVAAVIAPVVIPAVRKGSRPVAKSLLKGGMLLYQKGREAVATSGEAMEDMLAEIHAEEPEKQASSLAGGQAKSEPHQQDGSHLSTVQNAAARQPGKEHDQAPS
jgi:hypothetical protein